MKQIRLAYPRRTRIYWIQDGLSSHWTPEIRAWAEANNLELVPTPTYASSLNRFEATFGALDEFVCKNALRACARRPRPAPQQPRRAPTPQASPRERRAAKTANARKLAA
jgi:hypothetical protein